MLLDIWFLLRHFFAYCQADSNFVITGEALWKKQGRFSVKSISVSLDDLESEASLSSEDPMDDILENACVSKSKPKKFSASMGMVSSMIGRDYSQHRSLPNDSLRKAKPIKLNSDHFPDSEIWEKKVMSDSSAKNENMHCDLEQFLFQMLGEGFQLEMEVIHNVVGQCGYDMEMSMDKLLDLSAGTLGKKDDILGIDSQKLEDIPGKGQPPQDDFSGRSNSTISTGTGLQLPGRVKEKHDLQNEVLQALFVPKRIEETHEKTQPVRDRRRPSLHGRFVAKPLEETSLENITFITRRQLSGLGDQDVENSYESLREAVKEYWVTMKEYYKAALDEFIKKDHEKAQKFLDEGHFFMKKAREADEASEKKLTENSCTEEEFSLNMYHFEPKEAVRMLKLHLSTYSGLPFIQQLKLIVGTRDNKEDAKEGPRKRMIIKLLDRESIPWTEDESGQTISIPVDQIDPKKLSFANK